MFVTRITVPITNYEGNGIFEKHLYFECDKLSPTKEQVIAALEGIDKENQQYPEYYGEENEALEIVKTVKEDEWKCVNPFSLVGTNTFVNHPKFGQ
jgi:hypothetical protein